MHFIKFALFLYLILALAQFSLCAQCEVHASNTYSEAGLAEQSYALPGFSRSVHIPGSYSLVEPNSRVYSSGLPGWNGSILAAAVITPTMGANFAMYMVKANAKAEVHYCERLRRRLVFVLSGALRTRKGDDVRMLNAGGFVYMAPGDASISISVMEGDTSFVLIDKALSGDTTIAERSRESSFVGHEEDIAMEPVEGEMFKLRRLLDKQDYRPGFNIHIMDFEPGEYLNVKEMHFNQHGLLMLQGQGIYMLNNHYFPVAVGMF